MAHSLVMAGESAVLRTNGKKARADDVQSSEE
jgi:hypothetical protein